MLALYLVEEATGATPRTSFKFLILWLGRIDSNLGLGSFCPAKGHVVAYLEESIYLE
jgi:hypothetical protein